MPVLPPPADAHADQTHMHTFVICVSAKLCCYYNNNQLFWPYYAFFFSGHITTGKLDLIEQMDCIFKISGPELGKISWNNYDTKAFFCWPVFTVCLALFLWYNSVNRSRLCKWRLKRSTSKVRTVKSGLKNITYKFPTAVLRVKLLDISMDLWRCCLWAHHAYWSMVLWAFSRSEVDTV